MILYNKFQTGGVTPAPTNLLSGSGWNNIMSEKAPRSTWDSIKSLWNDTDWGEAAYEGITRGTRWHENAKPEETRRLTGNLLDAGFSILETPYRWLAGARSDQPYSFEDFYTGKMPEDVYQQDSMAESLLYDPTTYIGAGLLGKAAKKVAPKLIKKFPKAVNKAIGRDSFPEAIGLFFFKG